MENMLKQNHNFPYSYGDANGWILLAFIFNYRTEMILDQWKKKATLYKTDVLLVPLGDDFRYLNKEEFDAQFGNYERIFKYLEEHPELGAEVGREF